MYFRKKKKQKPSAVHTSICCNTPNVWKVIICYSITNKRKAKIKKCTIPLPTLEK